MQEEARHDFKLKTRLCALALIVILDGSTALASDNMGLTGHFSCLLLVSIVCIPLG